MKIRLCLDRDCCPFLKFDKGKWRIVEKIDVGDTFVLVEVGDLNGFL